MSTRPSSRAEIPSRFLDFSMLCRQENFPPAIFGASRPVDGAAADFGARPGASVCRRRSRFFPRFSIYQCFASRKISLPCNNENFLRRSRAAFCKSAERTAGRASVYHILWLRGLRDHTISGPGFNLFKWLRRHFRATPSAAGNAAGFGTRRAASIGRGVGPARSRKGDRVRPSARSSRRWDEAVPQPWFGRREGRAERAVSKRKGMGRLGAENDDRLR
jgi:hypothetical protein